MKSANRIWLLKLVPDARHGRWICAAIILLAGLLLYGTAATLHFPGFAEFRTDGSWPVATFFVCAVAYITPVFHLISARAVRTAEALAPFLPNHDPQSLRTEIEFRSRGWVLRTTVLAVALWLFQSRVLAGSWRAMTESLTTNLYSALMSIGPLPVWVTMGVAMSALFGNALFFRRLAKDLQVRILEPDTYMPVGEMAVTSTLVVVGALGLLSIMWLGGPVNWWTTLPALTFFTPLLILLLLIPVWPLRTRLVEQRQALAVNTQASIRHAQSNNPADDATALAAALALRREVARLPTWPFDVPAITRFISYAVIVPLTWAGAALIEMVVDALLS
ncbi:MAG: hypothetical protein AAGL69_17510 [Pseudomonadota bacterium]